MKSSKSIIIHIPDFLNYYKEKNYSNNTLENYNRYLKRFVCWLKENNKKRLKPHELTQEDVSNYITYLSNCINLKTGKNLKKVSQNYYLIALRALLSYFSEKDIVSLSVDKIKLPKQEKVGSNSRYLDLGEIKQLSSLPNIHTEPGLRDKVILEVLIASGLKVKQLVNLDIDKIDTLPYSSLLWVKKYLNIRKDKNKALLINYGGWSGRSRRLTTRSVERILNKYGRLINLPFSLTPEILRWSHAIALLKDEAQPRIVKYPHIHKTTSIDNYEHKTRIINFSNNKTQDFPAPWHFIETAINKEINWFKNNISTLPDNYSLKKNPTLLSCDDCIFRNLATLVVSGRIKATEFRLKKNNNLWNNMNINFDKTIEEKIYHGKEWHKNMMGAIFTYFKDKKYKVDIEPVLNYGRADLGVYPNMKESIYVEIGTVSLYKLWHNLLTMKDITVLIISSKEKIIELRN